MYKRLSSEQGFTLIELLVVILIIGILAAVALPNFVSQRDRGFDATAKANARNTVSHVEACYVNTQDYRSCRDADALGGAGLGITLGTDPGEVDVQATGMNSYIVVAKSPTHSTYTITREASRPMERTCDIAEGKTTAGCKDGTW